MDSVKVALRIRPFIQSEIDSGCRQCVERTPEENQIAVGKWRQLYSFNYVFDEFEGQKFVYDVAVQNLLDNLFKGYNVTILAYGQTGSGKTYTMGTNYNGIGELGVIPRAITDIFKTIERSTDKNIKVTVSFLELYNESLFDLLTRKPREESIVDLRESQQGISIPGLTAIAVSSMQETLDYLKEGSSGRVTGATAMNATSSRSHAIFTVNIRISSQDNPKDAVTSKFHLVDLAGSERSKKTCTTGDRFKEGVNINKGLLNLGNVISQLGEGCQYISYRDSKLTRLLQDSLGGNSVTLLIACISPADYNQDETLSTLRYADRVKKIKNKPVVNQDPQFMEIVQLKKEVEDLRLQLINRGSMCPPEHANLEEQVSESMNKNSKLLQILDDAMKQSTGMFERALLVDSWNERLKIRLDELVSLADSLMLSSDAEGSSESYTSIKDKIMEIKDDYNKAQMEIFTHEKQINVNDSMSNELVRKSSNENPPPALAEEVLSQAKINKEIQDITNSLLWKEELINKLKEDCGGMTMIHEVSVGEFMVLKEQLAALQKERESLVQQIELANGGNTPAAKLAAQRRKQLQDLEHKYSALQKKLHEKERVLQMKQKSEEKIANLKKEVQVMRQIKVKLIRDLRNECNKNKTLKDERNRELIQLKSLNAKKDAKLQQMEQLHSHKQNVLKRKLEAVAAANKRIMDVLARQKMGERKIKSSVSERITELINEELEIIESACHADKSLHSLLHYRASLHKEVEEIKESLTYSTLANEERIELEEKLKLYQSDMELRSVQISDLQQQIQDAQQANKGKNRWDHLQSMSEAKCALSHLFDLASDLKRDAVTKELLYNDLKESNEEVLKKQQLCERRLEDMNSFHAHELNALEREYEEKISLLLRQYKTSERDEHCCDGHLDQIRIQNSELEKMEALRQEIEKLKNKLRHFERGSRLGSFEEAYSAFLSMTSPNKDQCYSEEEETNKENSIAQNSDMDYEEQTELSDTPKTKHINILQASNNQGGANDNIDLNESIEQSMKETLDKVEEESSCKSPNQRKRAMESDQWESTFISKKKVYFEN